MNQIENPNCFKCKNPQQLNPYGHTFVDVYNKLKEKRTHIIKEKYNYIEIWECDFI